MKKITIHTEVIRNIQKMKKQSKSKKNIILITIDCLRPDHLSCYGSKLAKTPNIDSLAKEGVTFLNAFANGGYTSPSVSSFLTSMATPYIKREHLKIQEILKDFGYKTYAINPNVQVIHGFCKKLNLTQGFDKYETLLSSRREKYEKIIEEKITEIARLIYRGFYKKDLLYNFLSNLICFSPLPIGKPAPRADIINEKAISLLKNAKEPIFLWLFYLDVHEPYLPRKNLRDVSLNRKLRYFKRGLSITQVKKLHSLYKEEIEILDRKIGDLFLRLKELNLYHNSHIILTADHGEQFLEHGRLGHTDLYDEGIAIPLIIKEAGKKIENKIVDLVSLIDLAPTIADLAGIKDYKFFSGNSLRPCYISNTKIEKPVVSYLGKTGLFYSYRIKNWKLIVRNDFFEMYDLKSDPYEKNNIYHIYPETASELRANCDKFLKYLKKRAEFKSEELKVRKAISNLKL